MKQRRRPARVVYTRTVYYGGRPPFRGRGRRNWQWIGFLAAIGLFLAEPDIALRLFALGVVIWIAWRVVKVVNKVTK